MDHFPRALTFSCVSLNNYTPYLRFGSLQEEMSGDLRQNGCKIDHMLQEVSSESSRPAPSYKGMRTQENTFATFDRIFLCYSDVYIMHRKYIRGKRFTFRAPMQLDNAFAMYNTFTYTSWPTRLLQISWLRPCSSDNSCRHTRPSPRQGKHPSTSGSQI